MATIKAIDVRSIHQIQSGQVIVDLCSVVKELVENSLDAGATSIDVRFRDYGLQAVEVQDNGNGISPDDYKGIALKHHTSKLSTYTDLNSLQTFGFRGEALSSLCALSNVHIITACSAEAPKGSRLEFEISGRLRGRSVVASQKGTTVVVEKLFGNLPVRRRELEKNVKREYNKVLSILNAYACISTGVKFSVSNHMVKGKKTVAFSTNSNLTTRENIANVFGAKTLTALVPLDLKFELQSTSSAQKWSNTPDEGSKEVCIVGHISRPTVGEGRQMPDRQMFFVNSRPCGQPQVAKAFNEVYKSYNVSQSPFIFANLCLDENSYDVNVSPDKRTILLHDQNALLESLKTSLIELFESTDQTIPHSLGSSQRLPAFKQLSINHPSPALEEDIREVSKDTPEEDSGNGNGANDEKVSEEAETVKPNDVGPIRSNTTLRGGRRAVSPIEKSLSEKAVVRSIQGDQMFTTGNVPMGNSNQKADNTGDIQMEGVESHIEEQVNQGDQKERGADNNHVMDVPPALVPIIDFNRRISEQEKEMVQPPPPSAAQENKQDQIPSAILNTPRPPAGIIQSAFDRMRPKRIPADTATITIGSKTITSPIGTPAAKRQRTEDPGPNRSSPVGVMKIVRRDPKTIRFSKGLLSFAAPGTQPELSETESDEGGTPEDERDGGGKESASNTDAQTEVDNLQPSEDRGHGQPEEESLIASEEDNSDGDYVDEAAKKNREEDKVRKMIQMAEEEAARSSQESARRVGSLLKIRRSKKDSITQLVRIIGTSAAKIDEKITALEQPQENSPWVNGDGIDSAFHQTSDEERLSLTVSKEDFAQMRVIGQFNLGFIIASRPAKTSTSLSPRSPSEVERYDDDELFIIDQHASDEKYNFERLQAETVVQNQRLVKPRILELTAVEEEVVIEHQHALEKNGFLVELDEGMPVGRRCKLVSLPMSRGVVFDHRDLEELIALLADAPTAAVPRPSKVRRMFASRACRSSIMIGRTLTLGQMGAVLKHMGEIDKPWNCPHGRPTMRHLMGMRAWEGWEEGDGLVGMGGRRREKVDWRAFIKMRGKTEKIDEEEVGEEEGVGDEEEET